MVAEHDEALALQARLLGHCEELAQAISVLPSRRDGEAILDIWADIERLRHRASSIHRRLRARVRRMKAEHGRADHALHGGDRAL